MNCRGVCFPVGLVQTQLRPLAPLRNYKHKVPKSSSHAYQTSTQRFEAIQQVQKDRPHPSGYQPPPKTKLPHSREKKEDVPRKVSKNLILQELKPSTSSLPDKQTPAVPTYHSSSKSEMSVQEEKTQITLSTNIEIFLTPACNDKRHEESQLQITKELPLTPELSIPEKIEEGEEEKPVVIDPRPLPPSSDKPKNVTHTKAVVKDSANQREPYQLCTSKKIKDSEEEKPVVMDTRRLPSSSDKPKNVTQTKAVAKGSANQRQPCQMSSVKSTGEASSSESSWHEIHLGCLTLE